MTYYILFVIDLKSRKVHFAGATPNPGESFMAQIARNLTDAVDGFLTGHRFLICDRDSKFSEQFRRILKNAGVDVRQGEPSFAGTLVAPRQEEPAIARELGRELP